MEVRNLPSPVVVEAIRRQMEWVVLVTKSIWHDCRTLCEKEILGDDQGGLIKWVRSVVQFHAWYFTGMLFL